MPIPLAIPIALALAKGASGYFAQRKAEKEIEGMKDPFMKIQDEFFQNRNIAASEAQGGLSASALGYMTKENQRGLGSTISAIQQTGGTPNNISQIIEGYRNNFENIGLQDSQLHTAKIGEYMNRNLQVADQKTSQWAQNVLYPFQNKLQLQHQNAAIGKQNMWGGLSDLGSIASSAAIGNLNNDLQIPTGATNNTSPMAQILNNYQRSLSTMNRSSASSQAGMQRQGATGVPQQQGAQSQSMFQPINEDINFNIPTDYSQQFNEYKGGEY